MSDLKPCPFCGARDGRLVQGFTRATDDFAYWSVECLDCACEIASDASQEEADTSWNRRVPDQLATTPVKESLTTGVGDVELRPYLQHLTACRMSMRMGSRECTCGLSVRLAALAEERVK